MKNIAIIIMLSFPLIGFTQSANIQTAKKYAKLALQKEYGKENIRNISLEIIEWDFNYNSGRFDIYYKTNYETWLVAYWGKSSPNCQLQCDLNGSNAKFKFDGMLEGWKTWNSIYSY